MIWISSPIRRSLDDQHRGIYLFRPIDHGAFAQGFFAMLIKIGDQFSIILDHFCAVSGYQIYETANRRRSIHRDIVFEGQTGHHPAARLSKHKEVPHVNITKRSCQRYEVRYITDIGPAEFLASLTTVVAPILRRDDDETVRDKIIEAE